MVRSVAEILESWGRVGRDYRPLAQYELDELRAEWKGIGLRGLPFIEFIPIKIVSIIEKQVRYSLAEAIDYGDPYYARALELIGGWPNKHILEAFQATANKKISLGFLVSFSFSVGRVGDMLATLGRVFGVDMKHQLSILTTLWTEDEPSSRTHIIPNIDEHIRTLDILFRVRHSIVHEASPSTSVKPEDVDLFFDHAMRFTEALNWLFISQTLHQIPSTQVSMNEEAFDEARHDLQQLDAIRGGSREDFQNPHSHNQQIEHHWDEFCRLSAEKAAGYDGPSSLHGSMAPMIYFVELGSLARWRLDRLRRFEQVPF